MRGHVPDRRDGVGVALLIEGGARGNDFRLYLGVALGHVFLRVLVHRVQRVLRGLDGLGGRILLRAGGEKEKEESRGRREKFPVVHEAVLRMPLRRAFP